MNLMYGFFDTFGIIQVMTHGGPGNSTTNLIYKVYQDGFEGMDLGNSSAQSVLLMFLVIIVSLVQFKYLEKRFITHEIICSSYFITWIFMFFCYFDVAACLFGICCCQ